MVLSEFAKILEKTAHYALIVIIAISIGGCYRGSPSENPPVHLNQNMFDQPKYNPQSVSHFFDDSSTMRTPVPGTVARGHLDNSDAYYLGLDSARNQIAKNPAQVNMTLLKRGQERFNIYCSACHSRVGDGQGIMIQRGYIPPPSIHLDRLRQVPDGYLFDVITNGIRNMPPYRYQVRVADRWAIVAYVRALQRSHNATIRDIPPEMIDQVK
jgi:mono/diheme cytochrome c family protein